MAASGISEILCKELSGNAARINMNLLCGYYQLLQEELALSTLLNGKGEHMVGFILTGHGQFSTGLASAIHMVAGDTPNFETVTFDNDEAATFPERLSTVIESMRAQCDGVVVFCDLLGGTPFNQSMMCASQIDNVAMVCGANLPMLIEALFARMSNEAATVDELVSAAVNAGKDAVCHKRFEAQLAAEDNDDLFGDDEDGI